MIVSLVLALPASLAPPQAGPLDPVPIVRVEATPGVKHLVNGDTLELEFDVPSGYSLDGGSHAFWTLDPRFAAVRYPDELPDWSNAFIAPRVLVAADRLSVPLRFGALDRPVTGFLSVVSVDAGTILISNLIRLTVHPAPTGGGRIDPARIAVFANAASGDSLTLANEYMQKREIPPENLFVVSINAENPEKPTLTQDDFEAQVRPAIDALPASVDLVAIAWTFPFKVTTDTDPRKDMSITSAFLFGTGLGWFEEKVTGGCTALEDFTPSPLYDSDARDYGAQGLPRPAMLLAGSSQQAALDLIERGVASDGTTPVMRGSLVFAHTGRSLPREGDMQVVDTAYQGNSWSDVSYLDIGSGAHPVGSGLFFYQTGDWVVEDVLDNDFVPGAFADNLDSFSGNLSGIPGRMSVLGWLDAGATGSYGTVREPCATPRKFPRTSILMQRYFAGESLAEAYVKSVEYPQEGVFVGDPAACPFCPW